MAQTVDVDYFGCPQPADGGRYVLQKGSWFCLTCNSVAADSHVSCRRHAMWVEEYKSGRMLLPKEAVHQRWRETSAKSTAKATAEGGYINGGRLHQRRETSASTAGD